MCTVFDKNDKIDVRGINVDYFFTIALKYVSVFCLFGIDSVSCWVLGWV